MLFVVLYPSHLGTYFGQLSYLFVLYTLLPGVAVQIKKLTSISEGLGKNSICVLTQVTALASGVTGLNLQLSLSLDRMLRRQPSSFCHSLTKRKRRLQ